MKKVLKTNIAGKRIKIRIWACGMLSDIAAFISYGDTVILTNVNASEKPREV